VQTIRQLVSLVARCRLLLAIGALVLFFVVRQRVAGMDERFFEASLDGVHGLVRYLAGDYVGAARAYRAHYGFLTLSEAAQAVPTADPDVLLDQAEGALARQALDLAQDRVARVLALERDQYDALLLSSVVNARRRKYGDAIDDLNRALRYPETERRLSSFFTVLAATGELQRLPSKERPSCLIAHYHRYLRIFDHSRAGSAIRHAERAIAAGDRPADCLLTIGMVKLRQGKREASLEALRRAIEIDPKHAAALHAAAYAYELLGDLTTEHRLREAAAAAAPSDPFYAEPLYDLLSGRLGDYPSALVVAERIRTIAPGDPQGPVRVAQVHALLGDFSTAERYYLEGLAMNPAQPRVRAALGWALQQQGKKTEAVAAYEAAIKMQPYDPDPLARLAELYRQQRRFHESAAVLRNVIHLGDRDPGRYVMLCAAYNELAATAEYETCVQRLLARYTGGMIALPSVPEALRSRGLPLPIR
jgi:tetratricopeptide (TPR) repeat protein